MDTSGNGLDGGGGGGHDVPPPSPNSGGRKLNFSVFLTPQQFPKCLQFVFCCLIIILSWHPGFSLLAIVTYSSFLVTGFLIWINLLELPQAFPNKWDYLRLEFYYTVQAAVLFGVSSWPLFFDARFPVPLIIGLHAGVVYAAGGFAIWEELRGISKGRRRQRLALAEGQSLEEGGEQNLGKEEEDENSISRKLNFKTLLEPTTFPKVVQWVFCCSLSFTWTHSFPFLVSNISLVVTWTILCIDLLDMTPRYFSRKEYLQKQVYFSGGAAVALLTCSYVQNFDMTPAWILGLQAALAYVVGGFLLREELWRMQAAPKSQSVGVVVADVDAEKNNEKGLQGLVIHQTAKTNV